MERAFVTREPMLETIKQNAMSMNWVDFIVLASLFVGGLIGRKRGMSQEVLDLVQWLLIVVFGATLCGPVGSLIERTAHFSLFWARVTAYLFVVVVFMVVFAFVRKMVGEKLVGSDTFGAMEYYLGMLAGAVRFACILVVLMAFLNAKHISDAELAALAKTQKDNFGSISFPTLGSLQEDVFKKSLSGRSVRLYLSSQLIPSSADNNDPLHNSVGRQRGRAIDEAIGVK